MTKELNENTGFKVSIKTLIAVGAAMATVISMWFMLQADIAAPIATVIGMWFMLQADITEAKELPKADVSRMEFDMKDQLIRQTIMMENNGMIIQED